MASNRNNNEHSSIRRHNMHKMQLELNRLVSFSEYQQDPGALSCLTLARKGYYYDGRLIACFRCHNPIPRGENITAENLDEVHRRTSLNCSPQETVNVPLTQPISPVTESDGNLPEEPISVVYRRAWARAESRWILTSDSQPGRQNLCQGRFPGRENLDEGWRFRDEAARLRSFRGWPPGAPVQPEHLAAGGFYYTGTGDRVCCAFCKGVLSGWERGDDPTTEHDRHYGDRNCPFRRHQRRDRHDGHCHGSGPEVYCNDQLRSSLPVTTNSLERTAAWSEQTTVSRNESPSRTRNLLTNEQSRQVPKHPEFADQLQRFRTYPSAAFQTGQRAESLARAGFFYEDFEKFITQRKHTTRPVTNSPESEKFGPQRKHPITHVTASPKSEEFGTQREHTNPQLTTSPGAAEFGTQRKHTISHGTNRLVPVGYGCNRNGNDLHVTNAPASMEFDTQRNHAGKKRHTGNTTSTKVDFTANDANSNSFNHSAGASAGVSLKVPEETDDSSAHKTGGEQNKVGKECSSSNAADDDPEWREFFMCQICFSDAIRCWLLLPCHHMLCRVCKQKMLICPFCRTPVKKYKKIRYRCQK